MSDFDEAFARIVSLEGGYVKDPRDPGGETKYGISKRAYPDEDIFNLTISRAKELYKRDYWDAVKCDQIPFPMNLLVFDAAVNQGAVSAIMMLQRALVIPQDGIIGVATLSAVARKMSFDLCCQYMSIRALRYTDTRHFDVYGNGWFVRLFKLMKGLE